MNLTYFLEVLLMGQRGISVNDILPIQESATEQSLL